MPGRPTLSNALKLRLRFQPLRRHRLWQLLVRYLALGKTGNREQVLRSNGCRPRYSFLSNLGATATCFDYTNVEELNEWLRWPEILWSMEHAASQASTFKSP